MPRMGDAKRTYGQWWDSTEPRVRVSIADLERVGRAAYESVGASPDDASFLTATNLDKAIQGDHARGIGKIPGLIAAARAGKLDMAPTVEIVREHGATAIVDGGPKAFGRLVCKFGIDLAIDKAREFGVGFVGARATAELLTPFIARAVDQGMVAMAMVQSVPTVAPLGGTVALLGNAPMAWGVPTSEREPVICDMSFTQSSASPILTAADQGEQIAPGLLLDEHGNPTTNAADFPDWDLIRATGGTGVAVKGSLVPLGDSHKGFAMVFLIGLLSSMLTDTDPPWTLYHHLPERGRYGTTLLVIDPRRLDASGNVYAKVDAFIDMVTSAPRKQGVDEILYPGLRSQQLKRERRAEGAIAIPASQFAAMSELAASVSHSLASLDGDTTERNR
jgi:LDH2 family malate/lactate/ureidoglycolate dehydrogenase